MKRRIGAATTAVLIAGVTLAACGDDSDSGGGGDSDNAITITASEYAFAIEGEATGGFVQVTFENDGEEPHIVIPFKLQDGKTSADALPLLASEEQPDEAAYAEVFDQPIDGAFYGTPGLLASSDAETTVADFPTGNYVLVCFLPSPDGQPHAALGMVADLAVGEGETAAPATQGTIDVTSDSFTVPDGIQSGTYAVTNSNDGTSEFNMAGPTEASIGDFDAALGAYFGSIFSGGAAVPLEFPAPLVAGFSESMPPGSTGYIVIDLESGRYVLAGNSDEEFNTLVSGEFEVS
jgi:hypothetical protein